MATDDPALKIGALASAIASAFGGIDGVTVYDYDPGIAGVQHSMVMGVGDVLHDSTPPEGIGRQLGRRDWNQRWTVRLYRWLDDPSTDYAAARSVVGSAINAIDFDHTLGGECREASITDFSLSVNEPETITRRMLVGEFTVSLIALVTDPNH